MIFAKATEKEIEELVELRLADAGKLGLSVVELKATEDGYHLYQSVGFEDVVSKYHGMRFLVEK